MKKRILLLAGCLFIYFPLNFAFGQRGESVEYTDPLQFTFTLISRDQSGDSLKIDFGIHPNATFCTDYALGERQLPPVPPTGALDVRWVNPRDTEDACFGLGMYLDLRPYTDPAQIDTFKMRFQAESYSLPYEFTLSWIGEFTKHCDSLKLLYSGIHAGSIEVNMLGTSSHQITDTSVRSVLIIKWGAKDTSGAPPPPPLLAYPADGATGQPVTPGLSWNPSLGASSYHLQVSMDTSFITILYNDSALIVTAETLSTLAYNTAYYWHVAAKNGFGKSSWSDRRRFTTIISTFTDSVSVFAGWNIISVPSFVSDYRKTGLFPTSASTAYAYDHARYAPRDTLDNGPGYWLKFKDDTTIAIIGFSIEKDTIDLLQGWNMIGSVTRPIPTNTILSIPGGITTSGFFGYHNTYLRVDTLEPGSGYWVKASQPGKLILSSVPLSQKCSTAELIKTVCDNDLPPPPPGHAEYTMRIIPSDISLAQNYPNPANPEAIIQYDLPKDAMVRLAVYNTLGEQMVTLVNEWQGAGAYHAVFNGANLPSGIYFYKINACDFTDSKKLVLMR